MFLSSTGPLSTDGIGMITLSPLEITVNFVFVFVVKESAYEHGGYKIGTKVGQIKGYMTV
jgi:hypothetical protein